MQPELGRMDADRFLAWAVDQPVRYELDSLIHYVIVRPDTSILLHYQRLPGGDLLTRIVRDGASTLDPPGMQLVDIFGK